MSAPEELRVSQARERLAGVLEHAATSRGPVYITRRGRGLAAIVDAAELDRLTELSEDMDDILAAEVAREEMRATAEELSVSQARDEVKADLGLS